MANVRRVDCLEKVEGRGCYDPSTPPMYQSAALSRGRGLMKSDEKITQWWSDKSVLFKVVDCRCFALAVEVAVVAKLKASSRSHLFPDRMLQVEVQYKRLKRRPLSGGPATS